MRPTKLLMICLLRRSAALATGAAERGRGGPNPRARSRASSSSSALEVARSDVRDSPATAGGEVGGGERPPLTSGHLAFRLARRTDVPQIQRCNLATLPENYNANFYVNHMRSWPELTLVAEHFPEGCDLAEEGDGSAVTPLRDYWARQAQRRARAVPKKEIVGYILGKVEERPVEAQRQPFPPSRAVPLYRDEDVSLSRYINSNPDNKGGRVRFPSPRPRPGPRPAPLTEKIGHVTSLAVHHHARRLGVASSLINQLHYHLRECYGARSIGLHVRISNKAAVRLYCDDGYDVADIIPMYYGDGEDAYFMRKDFDIDVDLEARSQRQEQQPQRQWRRGEKEREEWLSRDAARSGSFFADRESIRDTLSEDERARVATGSNRDPPVPPSATTPSTSMSGQFKRNLRTFFNSGEPSQWQSREGQFQSPPWETGPEGLRLPRYRKVMRRAAPAASEATALRGLAANLPRGEDIIDVEEYEEEAKGALSGSV